MNGPCLCGDPYCPSCGNPDLAKYEDFIDEFVEGLQDYSMDEIMFVKSVIPGLVESYRVARKEAETEWNAYHGNISAHLEEKLFQAEVEIDRLQERSNKHD